MTPHSSPQNNPAKAAPTGGGPDLSISLVDQHETRRPHSDRLLGRRMTVYTPRGINGVDKVMIEAADQTPGEQIISLMSPNGLVPLAMAMIRPEAQVTSFHTDLYRNGQLQKLTREHGVAGVRTVCESELMLEAVQSVPDLVLLNIRNDMEIEFIVELVRQARLCLGPKGKLLAGIHDIHDRWLRAQVEKAFGNVSILVRTRDGMVYTAKRVGGKGLDQIEEPQPTYFFKPLTVSFEDQDYAFETPYGVYSSEELHESSRGLLEQIDSEARFESILDIGCGWGPLGLIAARRHGARRLTMIDSNVRAVEAARRNAQNLGPAECEVRHEAYGESLDTPGEQEAYDAVLINPPYGEGDFKLSETMLTLARKALRPGGRVWLAHKQGKCFGPQLERNFSEYSIAQRRGFDIVTAVR